MATKSPRPVGNANAEVAQGKSKKGQEPQSILDRSSTKRPDTIQGK
jgi:hypothetical protein